MKNLTKFRRLLIEDEENIDLTDEDLELVFDGGDDAHIIHSVFANCFIDWTREDLLSCFDEDTYLVTEDEWTNNYFVKHKGEVNYKLIADINSVFIASDVTFLGESYYKHIYSNLTIVNSKVVINNPLLASNYIMGESSEVSIINRTGSSGYWGKDRLELAFYQSSDPYKGCKFNMTSEVMDDYLKHINVIFFSDCDNSKVVIDLEKYVGVEKVDISFGELARDNMIELINVSKDVKVNVDGDGVYKNKTLVNGKLTPDPIYLAC